MSIDLEAIGARAKKSIKRFFFPERVRPECEHRWQCFCQSPAYDGRESKFPNHNDFWSECSECGMRKDDFALRAALAGKDKEKK